MKTALAASAASAVLALLATGCSSSGTVPGAPSRATDPLGTLVLDAAPAGFAAQSGAAARTGPTDLAQAVRDDAQPDAHAALTSARFVRGYQRLWTDDSGGVVAIQLYRFATSAGASAYRRRLHAIALRQAQHVVPYAVPGVVPADGGGVEVDVEGDVTEQVVAVSGTTVVEVLCSSRDGDGLRERARTLAATQYRRVSAAG